MKKKIFFILFPLFINQLSAQNTDSLNFATPPTSFDEVVRDGNNDTVIFYFSQSWQLVKPVCASIFRTSLVDTMLLTFSGDFTDYYTLDSTIALEGNYTNGKKEGKFNFYFPNGQLKESGDYKNDFKIGIWEYFYENGERHQVLEFANNDVLIKEFWNEEGKKLVENGNGEWFTYTDSDKFVRIEGEVLNGRKNGTWKKFIPSRKVNMNIEKFKDGKLTSGKFFSTFKGTESYKDTSYCSVEEIPSYVKAESLQLSPCIRPLNGDYEYAVYPGGMQRFYDQISRNIKISGTVNHITIIKVRMTIDSEGKMMNFVPISNTGLELSLISALQLMDKWHPAKFNGAPRSQTRLVSFTIR